MKTLWPLTCLLIVSHMSFSQPVGYNFGKQIIIDAAKIPGTTDLINFPVLFSVTDANLRTVANGGGVQNANGYDFLFTSSDCMTALDHQLEKYNPVTGEVVAWVRIPDLSATANTIIHLYYGNSSVAASHETTATWNSNYLGVYHFNNMVTDASSAGKNLTNVNSTTFTTSIIGEGRDLNNSTNTLSSNAAGQHLVLPNGLFSGITNFTWSGWVYLDRDATNWERIFDFGQSSTINFFFTPSHDVTTPAQTRVRITTGGGAAEQGAIIANPAANTGAWIYWSTTIDNATNTLTVYRDGAVYGSATGVTLRPNNMEATTANYFGRSQYGADHYIDAKFDEFRLANTVHSADWIATEYNNQSSPATFHTVSAEFSASALCVVLPVGIVGFTAEITPDNEVEINWTTVSEISTDQFTVQRSGDGINWENVQSIPGSGNSTNPVSYKVMDNDPLSGLSYYRLKESDTDGSCAYSAEISVNMKQTLAVYPNPSKELITVTESGGGSSGLTVLDQLGNDVTALTVQDAKNATTRTINLSLLAPGIYFIKTNNGNRLIYKL